MTIKMALTVHGIDRDNDPLDAKVMPQHRIGRDRKQNGRRVGEAGRLHDETIDTGDNAPLILIQQAAQGLHQVVSH